MTFAKETDQGMDEAGGDKFLFPMLVGRKQRRPPDDPFFRTGDEERELLAKQAALELSPEEATQLVLDDRPSGGHGWTCPFSGCSVHLDGPAAYDQHYSAAHVNSCRVCGRAFPTVRLLSIHVSESHDAFFQAKAARGFPMYECLVEGCGSKFQNGAARQQHLRDRHHFAATFAFGKGQRKQWPVEQPGKRTERSRGEGRKPGDGSSRRRQKGGVVAETNGKLPSNGHVDVSEDAGNKIVGEVPSEAASGDVSSMDVEHLSEGFSRLSTKGAEIPRNITFGRHRGRLFDESLLSRKHSDKGQRTTRTLPT